MVSELRSLPVRPLKFAGRDAGSALVVRKTVSHRDEACLTAVALSAGNDTAAGNGRGWTMPRTTESISPGCCPCAFVPTRTQGIGSCRGDVRGR